MHQCCRQCVSFFSLRDRTWLFGASYLKAFAGRIGNRGKVRHLDSGLEAELFDELVAGARLRALHGYELVESDLPAHVTNKLTNALNEIAEQSVSVDDVARARVLRAARALVGEHAGDKEVIRSVDRELAGVEPEKRRASKHHRRRRLRQPGVSGFEKKLYRTGQRKDGQHLRDLVALIAQELLRDDPLAADCILSGLTLPFPEEINGSNVTFLRFKGDRILSMSIDQFLHEAQISGEQDLTPHVATLLRKVSVKTVADLVRFSCNSLAESADLSSKEINALVRVCARYKIYFSMDDVRFWDPHVMV